MRQQHVSVAAGLALAIFTLAMTLASCSSENPPAMPDASTTPDTGPTAVCPSGYMQCGNDCFAVKRDPENCGACGHACKSGEVCVQGGCALQCGGNTIKCGALCVSSKSDPDNCGMCANKCPQGQVCNLGKCDTTCQQGLTNCSNACVDLQTDDDHCGMCGNACSSGQQCKAGKCVANCQQGWTSCPDGMGGTTCVDLRTDNANCGTCGTQCTNGQFCSPGADGGISTCGMACFGGTTKCGNKCVDLMIDPQNCGSCGTPCNGTCFGGMCCAGQTVWCNGACRDLKTDKNNCGGCGVVCGGACNGGQCCGASEVICNGKCTNTQFDPKNCGSCGFACTSDAAPNCSQGICASCPAYKQCDQGVDVTNSNLTWVVCQSDCSTAWVSMLSNGGGTYHAEYICKQLGYAKLGAHGGTCGNVCGYCQGQTSCSQLGSRKFDNGGSCGSDQYGQMLCNTVMWECTQ